MPKAQTKATAPTPAPDTPLPVEYAVRIYPVKDSKYTLANANVDINGVFAIRGVKVIRGEKGPFVAMPQYKDSHGDYHDICFPCSKERRQQRVELAPDLGVVGATTGGIGGQGQGVGHGAGA